MEYDDFLKDLNQNEKTALKDYLVSKNISSYFIQDFLLTIKTMEVDKWDAGEDVRYDEGTTTPWKETIKQMTALLADDYTVEQFLSDYDYDEHNATSAIHFTLAFHLGDKFEQMLLVYSIKDSLSENISLEDFKAYKDSFEKQTGFQLTEDNLNPFALAAIIDRLFCSKMTGADIFLNFGPITLSFVEASRFGIKNEDLASIETFSPLSKGEMTSLSRHIVKSIIEADLDVLTK